ncbi:protein phosphatase 1 regulatory subunit 12A isoform X18 [Sitodiplosis mosellana]|uniref:protein phosphatase 1 regulatory subunit 12A isoform X18 n=1 Tax=Sitodiplosis mosellana TaxID=263140 RepID=UPI00244407C8|nr:protein phosphatase 1 regulatory subunit 12A isoform X18 [Sitodiplosis mosellana]
MSFDARNNSAVLKRAEQLKRWEDSDTNRASNSPKDPATRRVKFSSGCVFLAACLSGDKEDIIRLIENGVDIDTANVDGLTALHQACIDDNLEMVEFLVQHGADVNKQDNEGWTPLHATASCGFLSIAQYLIENNADLAAVNSDGDLPIDLSDSDRMHALLEKHLIEQGIDCDEARQSEEKIMLHDAECWLRNDASEADRPHPRTGATALHVAAAKGYNKVLGLLLATRADVDKQDNDGWTPLHAAARWGQKDAAQMLVAALADMDIKNHAGQTPIDVADPSIVKFLEELQKSNKRTALRRPASQIRLSDNIYNHFNIETPKPKVMKSDTKNIDEDIPKPPSEPAPIAKESQLIEDEAPWRRPTSIRLTRTNQNENPPKIQVPEKESPNTLDSEVMLRRTQSFENDEKSFVPPARDEESETQRKAHAKRVRETRRSTQGVTLEEIKSAEELVKKKNLNNNNNSSSNNNNNNFKLEDATLPATSTNSIVDNNNLMGQRRTNLTTTNTVSRPLSAPVVSSSTIVDNTSDRSKETPIISTDVTVSLKKNRSGEDKENEKENDSRGGQATQAIIQRRRRPKRRSTGVCNVGAEDADNERQDSPVDGDESGSEKTSTRSRLGSSSSITSEQSPVADNSENGGEAIDYKALYEAARSDNDKLKNQLKKKDDDLMNARAAIDRFTNATTKNTLSELEKREKRAMERKISEMEEELKQLDVLKTENQRLRDENGALIRVISKLSK